MSNFKVDVIIPTYNRLNLLEKELESLSTIPIPSELQYIHIIENGGVFGAKEIVDKYTNILPVNYHYLDKGNLSLARNEGMRISSADFLIFYDDDMTFINTSISAYVEAFKQNGRGCFYGGSLAPNYEDEPEQWLIEFLPESAKGFSLGSKGKLLTGSPFLGGNHAVPREALEAIGGYDLRSAVGDNTGAVGEEKRMQAKLAEQGYKAVYVPDALVLHFVPKNNCDKKWLKKRARRHGFTEGCIDVEKKNVRLFMGFPLFCVRALLTLWLAQCFYFVIFRKKLCFKNTLKIQKTLGYISAFFEDS